MNSPKFLTPEQWENAPNKQDYVFDSNKGNYRLIEEGEVRPAEKVAPRPPKRSPEAPRATPPVSDEERLAKAKQAETDRKRQEE